MDSYRATAAHVRAASAIVRGDILERRTLDRCAARRSKTTKWRMQRLAHEVADPLLRHPGAAARELEKRGKSLIDIAERRCAFHRERGWSRRTAKCSTRRSEQINSSLYQRVIWLVVFGLARDSVQRVALASDRDAGRRTAHHANAAARIPQRTRAASELRDRQRVRCGKQPLGRRRRRVRRAPLLRSLGAGAHRRRQRQRRRRRRADGVHQVHDSRHRAAPPRSRASFLQEFNRAFPRTVENPYLFVSMFVGILDTWTLRLDYASAGHDIAFVRRAQTWSSSPSPGPCSASWRNRSRRDACIWNDGDMIVLSTDGLTEARDSKGDFRSRRRDEVDRVRRPSDPRTRAALIDRARARSEQHDARRRRRAGNPLRARACQVEAPRTRPQVQTMSRTRDAARIRRMRRCRQRSSSATRSAECTSPCSAAWTIRTCSCGIRAIPGQLRRRVHGHAAIFASARNAEPSRNGASSYRVAGIVHQKFSIGCRRRRRDDSQRQVSRPLRVGEFVRRPRSGNRSSARFLVSALDGKQPQQTGDLEDFFDRPAGRDRKRRLALAAKTHEFGNGGGVEVRDFRAIER